MHKFIYLFCRCRLKNVWFFFFWFSVLTTCLILLQEHYLILIISLHLVDILVFIDFTYLHDLYSYFPHVWAECAHRDFPFCTILSFAFNFTPCLVYLLCFACFVNSIQTHRPFKQIFVVVCLYGYVYDFLEDANPL